MGIRPLGANADQRGGNAAGDVRSQADGLMNQAAGAVQDAYGKTVDAAVEGANGELGFYVVSDGTDRPYRVRVRPPCFALMSGVHKMLESFMMADIVPTFGSINMIAGELDR
jgi:NADH:ubiquinone oxidoreductase subunit D